MVIPWMPDGELTLTIAIVVGQDRKVDAPFGRSVDIDPISRQVWTAEAEDYSGKHVAECSCSARPRMIATAREQSLDRKVENIRDDGENGGA